MTIVCRNPFFLNRALDAINDTIRLDGYKVSERTEHSLYPYFKEHGGVVIKIETVDGSEMPDWVVEKFPKEDILLPKPPRTGKPKQRPEGWVKPIYKRAPRVRPPATRPVGRPRKNPFPEVEEKTKKTRKPRAKKE